MKKYLKKYMNCSLIYAVLAMIFGVFYREFTKFIDYNGHTVLSVVHTHYFMLGMIFFLILLLFEMNFTFSGKTMSKILIIYHTGLNLTVVMFLVRGILQSLQTPISAGINSAVSGIAGIGHILLGVSIILVLVQLKKGIKDRLQ